MKKKIILICISSLLMVAHTNKLNFFQTISSSELAKHIVKTTEDIHSPIDHNISSYYSEVMIDMYSGDATLGYTIFKKKLEKICQLTPIEFAIEHTQDEWEAIVEAGQFREKILQICPEIENTLQDLWLPNLYRFVYDYANDSDNILIEDE